MYLLNFLLFLALFFTLYAKSPFMMCLSLIFIVMNLGAAAHFLGSTWLMYTLIIMFLGGMMIVFVYTASVNNNFKIFVSFSGAFIYSLAISAMVLCTTLPEVVLWHGQAAVWIFSVSASYSYLTFLAFTLLLSLFIIVKMVQLEQGPLKV